MMRQFILIHQKEIYMTKESVINGLIDIVSNAQMDGTFHDAYNNDKCYYYKLHKHYIVQTIKINEQFGCAKYSMNPELSAVLRELGCKRTTRQLYEHCVCTKVVSCWIIPDNILK